MNCKAYRRALDENPAFDGGAGHIAECAACRAYRQSALAFETTLAMALELPVPGLRMPELPPVDGENVVSLEKRRRGILPGWFALAASVALVGLVSFWMLGSPPRYDTLAEEIVAHLDHEPAALRVTDKAVSDRRLHEVVPANIANLDQAGSLVTYAQTCKINGKLVPHLVIQGSNGPVTLLLMPEESIDQAEVLEGEGINGVLVPVGNGSIAIIGDKGENLEAIQQRVVNSVTWSA